MVSYANELDAAMEGRDPKASISSLSAFKKVSTQTKSATGDTTKLGKNNQHAISTAKGDVKAGEEKYQDTTDLKRAITGAEAENKKTQNKRAARNTHHMEPRGMKNQHKTCGFTPKGLGIAA